MCLNITHEKVLFIALGLIITKANAQSVGIGTTTPNKAHVNPVIKNNPSQ